MIKLIKKLKNEKGMTLIEILIVLSIIAGAMAAICLARGGASVSLFDHSHPREKPCGGGLTGRAVELASEVIDLASLPAVAVHSALVESARNPIGRSGGSRDSASVDLHAHGISSASSLIVLSRASFDAALVEAAVASGSRLIRERVLRVQSCRQSSGRMTLRTGNREYDADFLLGADGANSLVRRNLSRPFARTQLSIGAGFFVRGATARNIAIKCVAEQPGYLWSFPRPDHLAIGICTPASEPVSSIALQQQTHAWIASHQLDRGGSLERYAWPIPSLPAGDFDRMEVSGSTWMLLGDAAGLVDPLTREGIYYALLSGRWAAESLLQGSAGASTGYEMRLRDELYPELARAATLSRVFFTASFSELLVEALQCKAAMRSVFVDLVAGSQPYRGLRRRLLLTGDWKSAGKLLWRSVVQSGRQLRASGTSDAGVGPRAIK